MDPYSSPYIIPNNCLQNPFPRSLRKKRDVSEQVVWVRDVLVWGFGYLGAEGV